MSNSRLQETEWHARRLRRDSGPASSGDREPVDLPMHSQQKLLADVDAAREEIAQMSELLRQATAESQRMREHNAQLEDRISKLEGNQESCRLCRDRAVRSGIDRMPERASGLGDDSAPKERPRDVDGVSKDWSLSPERTVARGSPRPWTAGNHSPDRTKHIYGQAAVPYTNLELARHADPPSGSSARMRNRPVSAMPSRTSAAMRLPSSEREKKSSEDNNLGMSHSSCSTRASTRLSQRTPPMFGALLATTSESARPMSSSPDFLGDSDTQLDLDTELVEADLVGQGGYGKDRHFSFPLSPSPDIVIDAAGLETPTRSLTPRLDEESNMAEAQDLASAWDAPPAVESCSAPPPTIAERASMSELHQPLSVRGAPAEVEARPMSPLGGHAYQAVATGVPPELSTEKDTKAADVQDNHEEIWARQVCLVSATSEVTKEADIRREASAPLTHAKTDKDGAVDSSDDEEDAQDASNSHDFDRSVTLSGWSEPVFKPEASFKDRISFVNKWHKTIDAARIAEEKHAEGFEAVKLAARRVKRVAEKENDFLESSEGSRHRYRRCSKEKIDVVGFLRQESEESQDPSSPSADTKKDVPKARQYGKVNLGRAEEAANKLIQMLQKKEAERLKRVQSPEEKLEELDTQLKSWRALRDAGPQPLDEAHALVFDCWDSIQSKRLQRDRHNFKHVFMPTPPREPPPDRWRKRIEIRTPETQDEQMSNSPGAERYNGGEICVMDFSTADVDREGILLHSADIFSPPPAYEQHKRLSLRDVFRKVIDQTSSASSSVATGQVHRQGSPGRALSRQTSPAPESLSPPESPKSVASDLDTTVHNFLVPEKPPQGEPRNYGQQWRPQVRRGRA